ncbi:hypothetical protein G6678_01645 [Polynucleobacter paneuropaeus]|nr:hypothetical protein G6678_01645 [Polynucleobacter paneuropaeus]
MIHDLKLTSGQSISTPILIIGAGTAGLLMAEQFYKAGIHTVVIESGGLKQEDETHPYNHVILSGDAYAGAAKGRFRCLGGTSTRWGGAMIPFLREDMDPQIWPIGYEELLEPLQELEAIFQLNPGSYELVDTSTYIGIDQNDFILRAAKWPPFKLRNVANLFTNTIHSDDGLLDVWINAHACEFTLKNSEKPSQVVAKSSNGNILTIHADQIILAAGAIENTRLHLLLHQQHPKIDPPSTLGHYFHDHISAWIADVKVHKNDALNRLFGFQFEKNGVMRNLRFELSPSSPLRMQGAPCFINLVYEQVQGGGFETLRICLQGLQKGTLPKLSMLWGLVRATPWLVKAIIWRYFYNTLAYPKDSQIKINLVLEQIKSPDNFIELSKGEVDEFGKPLASIHWQIDVKEADRIIAIQKSFQDLWNHSPLALLGQFLAIPAKEIEKAMRSAPDTYHPCGSTRMGYTRETGVVDSNLRGFAFPNVSTISTSVLPNAGGSNPTLMMLLLALRLAKDRISQIQSKKIA